MTGIDTNRIRKLDFIMTAEGAPDTIFTAQPSEFKREMIIPAGRSELGFYAWGNLFHSKIDRATQTIRATESRDSIWLYRKHVNTRCEDVYLTVNPESQTRAVIIILRGNLDEIDNATARLTGLDDTFTFDGGIMSGSQTEIVPVLVQSPLSGADHYQFQTLLTRQGNAFDAALEIELFSDGAVRSGTYQIGMMLFEAGEDLTKSSGHPIVIDLLLGNSSVFISIGVEDWVMHDVFEITY